jgi:uridylate kinase|tara:strand:- start:1065 stop:1739 length:675 start_codon:yes stop_codon:yes gene_type:complete
MKTIVLSLGGSLIAPDKVDINFLKNFKKLVDKYVKKNFRFVIICGGGGIARQYQDALKKIVGNDQEALDWIGISATHLNAFLLRCIFHPNSSANVIYDPTKKNKHNKKIILAGGWKPGWSTDYDAVLLAKNLKIKMVVNMSNIDYVYDKDPNKFMAAKKIEKISWKNYIKISGKKWKAGLNMPFDPIASKEAQKSKIIVKVIGKNLKNFENLLNNKKIKGTIIG